MSDKSLVELSEESKAKFGAGGHHDAAKLLTEARTRFPMPAGQRIDQGPDGTLCITTIEEDGKGGARIAKQVPVDGSSAEYRAEDYRDTSEDDKPAEEVDEETAKEAVNDYGKVNGPSTALDGNSEDADEEVGEGLTKAELQAALDDHGVKYAASANKAELLELYKAL